MDWFQILGPTVLVLVGGLISWYLKDRTEELRSEREKFRRERLSIYTEILEPVLGAFIYLESQQKKVQVVEKIKTDQYRKKAFELILYGSDDVVRAWNGFMQYMYTTSETGNFDLKAGLEKLGTVLLAVRRDLGNKNTNLEAIELFKWFLRDFDKLQK